MNLQKIVKALSSHVASPKDFRLALGHIHARDAHTLEATDGHRVLVVRTVQPHGLAPGLYDPKTTLARIKASVAPEPVSTDAVFPDVSRVIPERADQPTPGAIYVNPQYLADLAEAAALACDLGKITRAIRWQLPSEDLGPIRCDLDNADDVTVVGVLMPMRA